MRIIGLQKEVPYILTEHHKKPEAVPLPDPLPTDEAELKAADMAANPDFDRDLGPIEDAPVFFFRPLSPKDRAVKMNEFYQIPDDNMRVANTNAFYMDLFDERTVRIENLFIDDEAFDFTNDYHRNSLEMWWIIEVGSEIMYYSRLNAAETGK
jgi:hypothetical protein